MKIYHGVPDNMQGNVLMPLNALKNVYPETYASAVAKYDGREKLLEKRVPMLDCLWNDVIHFSPVHPAMITEALRDVGYGNKAETFFEIDIDQLDPANIVIYNHVPFGEESFSLFADIDWKQAQRIPEATKAYYKKSADSGRMPLAFAGIIHVLYKGTVDISKSQRIIA